MILITSNLNSSFKFLKLYFHDQFARKFGQNLISIDDKHTRFLKSTNCNEWRLTFYDWGIRFQPFEDMF